MKTIHFILFITIFAYFEYTVESKNKKAKKKATKSKNKGTPKGLDLKNHYGSANIGSPYGPTTDYADYVERNPDTYTPQRFAKTNHVADTLKFNPYPGYESKLNPHHIKSGDFKNIAPSASKVIDPEITGPKVHLQAEVEYPSNVKVPTFYGFKKEFKDIAAFDKLDGKIVHDKVLMNHPVYGYTDKVNISFSFKYRKNIELNFTAIFLFFR
jgi:hypothetical protein